MWPLKQSCGCGGSPPAPPPTCPASMWPSSGHRSAFFSSHRRGRLAFRGDPSCSLGPPVAVTAPPWREESGEQCGPVPSGSGPRPGEWEELPSPEASVGSEAGEGEARGRPARLGAPSPQTPGEHVALSAPRPRFSGPLEGRAPDSGCRFRVDLRGWSVAATRRRRRFWRSF